MNVWIVFDDCPRDFGDKEILKVYASKALADSYARNLKDQDPYRFQYLVVRKEKARSTP